MLISVASQAARPTGSKGPTAQDIRRGDAPAVGVISGRVRCR
jgi:hypothetical protein